MPSNLTTARTPIHRRIQAQTDATIALRTELGGEMKALTSAVKNAASTAKTLSQVKIRTVLGKAPAPCHSVLDNDGVDKAAGEVLRHGVTMLFVLDAKTKKTFCGIVTRSQICQAAVNGKFQDKVVNHMIPSGRFKTIRDIDTVESAMKKFQTARVHRLIVVDGNGAPIDILTQGALLRWLGQILLGL